MPLFIQSLKVFKFIKQSISEFFVLKGLIKNIKSILGLSLFCILPKLSAITCFFLLSGIFFIF